MKPSGKFAWIPLALLADDRLSVQDKIVWLTLNSFTDGTGDSFPSISSIAKRAVISKRSVQWSLSKLVQFEWLKSTIRANRKPTHYLLLTDTTIAIPAIARPAIARHTIAKSASNYSRDCVPSRERELEKEKEKVSKDMSESSQAIANPAIDEVPPDLPEPSVDDLAAEVLSYLNEKTKRKYRNTGHIPARLKETFMRDGRKVPTYTVDDCKKVIDVKCAEWMGTEQEKFLTPITLFRPANFDRYMNQGGKTGGFFEFLDSHPDLDYRKLPQESQFARSSKLLAAFKIAEDAGVTLTKEDYDRKEIAIGIKSREAHDLIKEKK